MRLPAMISIKNNSDTTGYIFDIQGLSVHDGPGCRTSIFLCGCTLNCFWCSNPEGIRSRPSLLHLSNKCISCSNCVDNCLLDALRLEDQTLKISNDKCQECQTYSCLSNCYTDALRLSGFEISLERVYEIITRDRQFWGLEGGITLTGGEPLLQIDFAKEILIRCHEGYIHTAIETCGNVPWTNFQQVIPYLDWIFFDLKHIDCVLHKKGTNSGNKIILENALRLAQEFEGRLIFRLPLIPNYNDSIENLNCVISFLKNAGKKEINILPLHHLGREKYKMLQREYLGSSFPVPMPEKLIEIEELFRSSGIKCFIGSETPF